MPLPPLNSAPLPAPNPARWIESQVTELTEPWEAWQIACALTERGVFFPWGAGWRYFPDRVPCPVEAAL